MFLDNTHKICTELFKYSLDVDGAQQYNTMVDVALCNLAMFVVEVDVLT